MTPVSSSNIAAIGYEPSSHVLAVRFASGGVWHYQDVPTDVAEQFKAAESKGIFFATQIRNTYASEQVLESDEAGIPVVGGEPQSAALEAPSNA